MRVGGANAYAGVHAVRSRCCTTYLATIKNPPNHSQLWRKRLCPKFPMNSIRNTLIATADAPSEPVRLAAEQGHGEFVDVAVELAGEARARAEEPHGIDGDFFVDKLDFWHGTGLSSTGTGKRLRKQREC